MSENYMAGRTVLVTRPKPDGTKLCEAIRSVGGSVIYFPTLDIIPTQQFISGEYDWLIFISPQAVRASRDYIKLNHTPRYAAIGPGTAQVLGLSNVIFPEKNPSASALLKMPALQAVQGQRIGIVQGAGGLRELSDTLTARGAQVTQIIAYHRCCSHPPNVNEVKKLLAEKKMDAMIITSSDSLNHFFQLIGSDIDIQYLTLITVSERLVKLASEKGFRSILLAENAGIHAMMMTLKGLGDTP